MKRFVVIISVIAIILLVSGLALLALLSFPFESRWELCVRDFEWTFIVVDEETGEPIPGADVTILIEDWRKNGHGKIQEVALVTSPDGAVKLLRNDEWCDDYVRPFRKTVTQIDRTWCAGIRVAKHGYRDRDDISLFDLQHTDKGYFRDEKLHRIEYVIHLQRR